MFPNNRVPGFKQISRPKATTELSSGTQARELVSSPIKIRQSRDGWPVLPLTGYTGLIDLHLLSTYFHHPPLQHIDESSLHYWVSLLCMLSSSFLVKLHSFALSILHTSRQLLIWLSSFVLLFGLNGSQGNGSKQWRTKLSSIKKSSRLRCLSQQQKSLPCQWAA